MIGSFIAASSSAVNWKTKVDVKKDNCKKILGIRPISNQLLTSLCFTSASFVKPKPSFHMIAHDRRIAENTASDRQRLYGNTFQRLGDCRRSSGILRFSDSGNREQSYGNQAFVMYPGRESFSVG